MTTLKNIFRKIVCFLGFHHWTKWRYVRHECNQKRRCEFCGREEQRLLHDWNRGVYLQKHSCVKKHTCRRCGVEETIVSHAYVIENPNFMRCRRCGDVVCNPYDYWYPTRRYWI